MDSEEYSDTSSVVDDSDNDPHYIPSDEDKKIEPSSSSDESDIPLQPVLEVTVTNESNKKQNFNVNTLQQSNKRKKNCNFCYFCECDVFNFARHIFRNHSREVEVQKILSLPKRSKKRKELLWLLRNKGNFLNANEKEKPTRKGTDKTSYLPCTFCLGYYSSKNLWRHRKNCHANLNKGVLIKDSQTAAHDLLVRHLKIDASLRQRVFPRMRGDKVSLNAKKDMLICLFGARYIKIHREKHFEVVTSRKMRELSRLVLELKTLQPEIKNLFTALKPQYYDLIVTATKNVSGYNSENETYKSPTLALNMGTTLKQCCEIAILHVLKRVKFDESTISAQSEADFKTLIQLIEAHWRYDISSVAGADLSVKKWNKITIVPLASDLKLLKDFLIKKANEAIVDLEKNNSDQQAYTRLLETIFCRVILLNRKRPGELERVPLTTYEQSITSENCFAYEEFSEAVSETEKALIKNFKRIVIRGKRGRGVPVLFTKDVQEHFNIILRHREGIVNKPNIYLFGKPNSSGPIIGHKILKKYASACGAKNPDAITCTRLRKHLATLTQLFNLSENDLEQLSSFMGHTIGVHRSSYRLPDDVFQTAKISKLLILMEKGKAGQFKGKCLDDIDINLEENLLKEGTNDKDDDDFEERIVEKDLQNEIYEEEGHSKETLEKDTSEDLVGKKMSKGKKRVLVPWTEEQKKVVCSYFKKHISSKKPPKRLECEELKEQHPELLKNKDWLKIKVFIQNIYTKI